MAADFIERTKAPIDIRPAFLRARRWFRLNDIGKIQLRKSLVTFAPLALCAYLGAALADESGATVYGTLDTAVANIQHSYNFDPNMITEAIPLVTKATKSATGMFSGGMSASKWGIKGQEDLGDGLKAFFTLESSINLGSGALTNALLAVTHNSATGPNAAIDSAIDGQLFSRGAYVGLSSRECGSISAGRNTTFFLDNILQTDPLLGSYAFSPVGYSGAFAGGGFTEDSRVDNSLKYKFSFHDVTMGLLYKFAGVSGSSQAQGAYQVNASYDNGSLGMYLGYQLFKDAFSAANPSYPDGTTLTSIVGGKTVITDVYPNMLTATAADTKALMLAGKYTLGMATFRSGIEREEFDNPSHPNLDVTITSLYGYNVASVATNAYTTTKTIDIWWFGGSYDFTNAFSILSGWYRASQNSWTAGGTQTCGATHGPLCSGVTNYYSLVADYRLSRRTDAYTGVMKDIASGGMSSGIPDPTNRVLAFGMRHAF